MPNIDHCHRLELILQHTHQMVVVTNLRREIEWVNPAYTRVTGWTLDEVKGRHPRSFLHGPRTSASTASAIGGLLRQGLAVTDVEILNYKKSGDPYWVCLNINPVLDAKGEIIEYIAIESDITDRKRRELCMARELFRLTEAQRIARLGYMEHDLATGMVHCSAEIFEILEAPASEVDLSYESLMEWTHPDDLAWVRQVYERAVNDGCAYESEHRVLCSSGKIKWVHMRGALDGWDDGSIAKCRLTVQDVTERKQAELLMLASARRDLPL
jgi:PAS domain S-box-containing protein